MNYLHGERKRLGKKLDEIYLDDDGNEIIVTDDTNLEFEMIRVRSFY